MSARKIILFLLYCILLIPALPPVFVPLFEPFTFGKTELFELLVELMALVWCAALFRTRPLRAFFPRTPLALSVYALFGTFAVSTLASADVAASFWGSGARNDGLFALAHFFFMFIILPGTLEKQDWLKLFRFSLCASAFVSFYALLQYFGFPFVRPSDGAIFGTMGNPAYLATYLSFHIFLALFVACREPSEKRVPLWQALAVFEIALLVMTHNRAGILGLACGLALFAGAVFFMRLPSAAVRKSSGALCIAAMLIALAVWAPAIKDYARADLTAQSRIFAWNASLAGIAQRPLAGHGANQFAQAYDAYAGSASAPAPTQESFDKPHNIVLEILFSYGIFGLAAYGALWFLLLREVRKKYGKPERSLWYGMFLAYGISLLFLFDTTFSLLMFFLFLAFFTSREKPSTPLQKNIAPHAGGVILLCFVLLFFLFHFTPLYSAYWARALFVNAETTGILDSTMKAKALRYDSFNTPFIRNAILYAE